MQIEEAKAISARIASGEDATELALMVNDVAAYCHANSLAAGWWHNKDGSPKEINADVIGCKIALMHSELSEALEGMRKNLNDDHLPEFPMVAVEFADAIIRIMDTACALNLPLGDALAKKLQYNTARADHKPENRFKEGGKSV